MTNATCKTCGELIRSRRSDKHSAQANMLRAVRKHYKIKHPNTLSRRISQGRKAAEDNPSVQDFVTALEGGVRGALDIYLQWTEVQYQATKRVMDAMSPLLPLPVRIAWEAIEAFHDARKAKRIRR